MESDGLGQHGGKVRSVIFPARSTDDVYNEKGKFTVSLVMI